MGHCIVFELGQLLSNSLISSVIQLQLCGSMAHSMVRYNIVAIKYNRIQYGDV